MTAILVTIGSATQWFLALLKDAANATTNKFIFLGREPQTSSRQKPLSDNFNSFQMMERRCLPC